MTYTDLTTCPRNGHQVKCPIQISFDLNVHHDRRDVRNEIETVKCKQTLPTGNHKHKMKRFICLCTLYKYTFQKYAIHVRYGLFKSYGFLPK